MGTVVLQVRTLVFIIMNGDALGRMGTCQNVSEKEIRICV